MTSIHDLLAATLTQLGLPAPSNVIQSVLMKDGFFVGHRLRYEGGYAIMRAGNIEFYGGGGAMLKTVALETGKEAA